MVSMNFVILLVICYSENLEKLLIHISIIDLQYLIKETILHKNISMNISIFI